MGYTIGSGKDSRQDAGFTEQEVLGRFAQNQEAIVAYSKSKGVPLEDAFQAVTGEPWPEGRSVKVHGDGRPEFTKDRTTKSVLGKYVAPAVAAGLTGGMALGAFGGAGLAGSGLASAGAVGSAPAVVPASMIGTGLGVGSGTLATAGAIGGGTGAIGGGGAAGGGFISSLVGGAKKLGGDTINKMIGGAGAGITGATQASANNRGVGLDAAMEQEKLRQSGNNLYEGQLINRSEDDRASLNDAFKNSLRSRAVLDNPKGYQSPMIAQMPGGKPSPLPNFGTGMSAPSEGAMGDAQGLYDQVSKRLTGGSQLPALERPTPYTNDPALLKPGGWEQAGNVIGPILGTYGAMSRPQVMPRDPRLEQK